MNRYSVALLIAPLAAGLAVTDHNWWAGAFFTVLCFLCF